MGGGSCPLCPPASYAYVHQLVEFSPFKLQQIKDEMAKDGTLQFLTQQLVQGCPDSLKKVHQEIKPYWNNQDDIAKKFRIPGKRHNVSTDLFKVNNSWYIVVTDYYSKFPFVS